MEALLLLIALTAVIGVLIVPAMRRRREAGQALQGAASAVGQGHWGEYGFRPVEELDIRLPGPDPELTEALTEVQRNQDWQPAARLLALTDDWELRWQRVQSLAGAAAMELAQSRGAGAPPAPDDLAGAAGEDARREADQQTDHGTDPETDEARISLSKSDSAAAARPPVPRGADGRWLRDWRTQRPDDAGGAEVYAQFLVWQAMSNTGSADARIILEEAKKVCTEAADLAAPDDPTPLITEVFVARGLRWGKPEFEALWASVLERAPHHMGAHLAALPYWSEQGQGSRDEAYRFAEHAAGSAPQGSLLPALPLFAVYGHLSDVNLVRGLYQSAVVEQAIEGARYATQQAPADHPVLPHVRHLLVLFLVRAERYPEAMTELRAVDGYVGAVPWVDGMDARAEYAAYRALAVAGFEAQGGTPATLTPPPF